MKATNRSQANGKPAASTKTARAQAVSSKATALVEPNANGTGSTAWTVHDLVVDHSTHNHLATVRTRISPSVRATMERLIAAAPSADVRIGMPIATFCVEGIGIASFVEKHSSPIAEVNVSFAPHFARLGGDIGPEILYLADEVRRADDMLAQETGENTSELNARAQKLLVEIRCACEVVVDDGVRDEKDTLVEGLRRKHGSRPRTVTLLANALASYVRAGRGLHAELAALADFDVRVIAEAAKLGDVLLTRAAGQSSDASRIVRNRRNRIMFLLRERVIRVRKLARFVFRNHPDVLGRFASAFHRSRHRRGKVKLEDGTDDVVDRPG